MDNNCLPYCNGRDKSALIWIVLAEKYLAAVYVKALKLPNKTIQRLPTQARAWRHYNQPQFMN